jgi:hypothetical protein
VVTDATKKLREPVAYTLLAFAGLVALASLFRLFVGSDFTSSAGVVQGTLTPPGLPALVLLAALAGSVALVAEFGERTPNARTVTLAALSITGVNVLLGIVTAFAGFGETGDAGLKVVGFIYALGGLALYGAVGLFLFKTFESLPAPVRAPKPSPHGQFAGQGHGQGQGQGQYAQQGGQFGAQYGQQGGQGQYGQYGSGQGQYAQPEHGQGQYGAYGAGAGAGVVGGYAAGQAEGQWPQEQSWSQGEQQQPSWPAGTEAAESGAAAEPAEAQPAEQTWSAEGHSTDPTQQWSADAGQQQQWSGQEAGQQQWPQEQQQWGGADSGQQQWPSQDQYGQQPAQAEWQQGQQVQPEPAEQAWSQQGWQQGGQSWQPEEAPAAEPAEAPAEAAPAVDETRVEPRVEEAAKVEDPQEPQGQGGQQGWWSQPS